MGPTKPRCTVPPKKKALGARKAARKEPPKPAEPPIVALAGSAGSLEFITRVMSLIPADCGLAFIVVLHLSPEHESNLPGILKRKCRLQVLHPKNGQTIEANHVYVIPPGQSLEVAGDRLRLAKLKTRAGVRTAVDLLLSSLAEFRGPRAAAVIFSGADSDGAAGLERIKLAGGFTLVQDPAEANHREMPRAAIATECVDAVLPTADMPARILEHFGRTATVTAPMPVDAVPDKCRNISAKEDAFINEALKCVRQHTGQDFNYYRRAAVLRHLERRMQIARIGGPRNYLKLIRKDALEAKALLRDLLVSVTGFFRDPESFHALDRVVPGLFDGKGPDDFVRVWVPACATGEEAYSVAMLLLDHARNRDNAPGVQVFGCDLDAAAVEMARSGLYPEKITSHVSRERLRRFFIQESGGFRVRRELRQSVLFAVHDVVKDSALARMDLITCRNLLIYLHADAKKRMFDVFHFALRERGLLFLGSSETIVDENLQFETLDRKHCIYRRKAGRTFGIGRFANSGAWLRALKTDDQIRQKHSTATLPPSVHASTATEFASAESSALAGLHLRMIERMAPASAVVDARHRIVHLSEKMGQFLYLSGKVSLELPHLVHHSLRPSLRGALGLAAERNAPVTVPRAPFEIDGIACEVKIAVAPAGDLAPGCLLVTFDLLKPGGKRRNRSESDAIARQLEHELQLVCSRLDETTKHSERNSAELKASNQELHTINQELHSATEELEINRQELQSINEELSAVNQELSINIEDLARANSDLHNLMNATAIPTVFLDRALQIKRYTPGAAKLFNLIPTDVGRQLAHLHHQLDYPELLGDVQRVLVNGEPIEMEVRDNSSRWFLARLLPYRTPEQEEGNSGVVLTFVDITERKRAEQALGEHSIWLRGQSDALQTAVNGAPLETSLGMLVRTATETLGKGTRAAFYLAGGDKTSLYHVVGMPADYAASVNGFKISPESLACGLATHRGKPVLTMDVQTDSRWEPWRWLAERFDYRGCWSFPVHTTAGKFVGTFAIYSRQPRKATERDLELASLLTNTASIIITRHTESEVRKRTENALRESEERMRHAISIDTVGVLFFRLDGRMTEMNDTFARMSGYTRAQLLEMADWMMLTAPKYHRLTQRRTKDLALCGETQPYEKEFVRPNGSRWWALCAPTRLSGKGSQAECVEFVIDLTEIKRAQQILSESKNRLK